MRNRWIMIGLMSGGFIVGCASGDRRPASGFEPVDEYAIHLEEGHPGVLYRIPRGRPEGEVRILSAGLVDLRSARDPETQVRALNVRMSVRNMGSAAPWIFDVREQPVRIETDGTLTPYFVRYSEEANGQLPLVAIAPGREVELDLFYPLPRSHQTREEIPGFEIQWRLRLPEESIVRTTPFERMPDDDIETDFPVLGVPPTGSVGPMPRQWWYDPTFRWTIDADPVVGPFLRW